MLALLTYLPRFWGYQLYALPPHMPRAMVNQLCAMPTHTPRNVSNQLSALMAHVSRIWGDKLCAFPAHISRDTKLLIVCVTRLYSQLYKKISVYTFFAFNCNIIYVCHSYINIKRIIFEKLIGNIKNSV